MSKISGLLKSKYFHFYLGLAVSLALIVWLYFNIEWKTAIAEMQKIHLWIFIPSTLVLALHFVLRALRWKYLLPANQNPPAFRSLIDSIMIGNFASYILPLRAGEFIRPYLLTRLSGYSFSTCFASVVIERFFDLSMVLLTFGLVLFYVDGFPDWVSKGAVVLSVMACGILIFILLGSLLPRFVMNLVKIFTGFLPKGLASTIEKFAQDLLEASQVLSNKFNLLMVVILTVLVWLSCYLMFYVFFYFFDIPASVSLAVTTAVIVALAVAAPSAPGFIGVYQTATIAAFAIFGISKELAAAYSIVTHFYQYVIFIVYACLFFLTNKINFSDVTSAVHLKEDKQK